MLCHCKHKTTWVKQKGVPYGATHMYAVPRYVSRKQLLYLKERRGDGLLLLKHFLIWIKFIKFEYRYGVSIALWNLLSWNFHPYLPNSEVTAWVEGPGFESYPIASLLSIF